MSFSWLSFGTKQPLFGAAVSHLKICGVSSNSTSPGNTAVYVDGYNLYYGRLRGTAFKWLDLVKLFDNLLARRDQNEKLARVYLLTAPALATFASHGNASVEAQAAYHRALKTKYDDRFETIYGTHSFDRSGTLLPVYVPGQPFDRTQRTRVWKLSHLSDDILAAAQLPDIIPTKKKPIRKPAHW
jgi:hypothetical protein